MPSDEPLDEGTVLRDQVGDPLANLGDLLPAGEDELVAPNLGGRLGFGGEQRRVLLRGISAAQFGVGGDDQVPVQAGGSAAGTWLRIASLRS